MQLVQIGSGQSPFQQRIGTARIAAQKRARSRAYTISRMLYLCALCFKLCILVSPRPSSTSSPRTQLCIATAWKLSTASSQQHGPMSKRQPPLSLEPEPAEPTRCVVKCFQKYRAEQETADETSGTASQSSWQFLPAVSKATPLQVPEHCSSDITPRRTEPPVALHRSSPKGIGKTSAKLPVLHLGKEDQIQLTPPHCFVRPPLGGLQASPPKATPRSLLFSRLSAPKVNPNDWTVQSLFSEPHPSTLHQRELTLPRGSQFVSLTTSQLRDQQRMSNCATRFQQSIAQIGDSCLLYQTLGKSSSKAEHITQLLAKFSPSTLERFVTCIVSFLEFWQAESQIHHGAIEPAFMADYLLAAQRSATQDRAVHRTSPLTALKSLRWLAKIDEWQELGMALSAPVVASYAQATISRDRRES